MNYKTRSTKRLSLRTVKCFLTIVSLLVVAGCSGGDIPAPASTGGSSGGGSVTVGDLTMGTLSFTDPVLSPYGITTIKVTVLDNGVLVATSIPVDFTSDCVERGDATITTTANTVNGTATATYTDNGCRGIDNVTASIVDGPRNTGWFTVTPLTLSTINFGSDPLSALGTTSVSVTLLDGTSNFTTATTVAFESICANAGLASITPSKNTIGGVATATYVDLGCQNVDIISISIPNLNNAPSDTASLTVNAISMLPLSFEVAGIPLSAPLSAYGTATIIAEVYDGASLTAIPIEVNFTSDCAADGAATITPTTKTINGFARATYNDNGCGGTDTITAKITNGPTEFAYFDVNPLTFGTLVFDPATLPSFSSGKVTATLLDGTADYLSPVSVNFSSYCASLGLATITPSAPANNGVATAIFRDEGCGADDIITVSVPALNNGPSTSAVLDITSINISDVLFGDDITAPITTLSAYGSTKVFAKIVDELGALLTSPIEVNFTSICADSNRGTITKTAISSNGVAQTNFTDLGCGSTDSVTATITNGPSNNGQLVVNALDMSNISFGTGAADLPPYSSTTVSVTLLEGMANYTLPTAVNFTSYCVEQGLATITPASKNTTDGTATVTYTDDGCGGDDQITTSVPNLVNGPEKSATLSVTPLVFGDITFSDTSISSYGSTTISTSLYQGDPTLNVKYANPALIKFSSMCLELGDAEIIPEIKPTSGGDVSVTYKDWGCNGDDLITVETVGFNNGPTNNGTLLIKKIKLANMVLPATDLSPYASTAITVDVLDALDQPYTETTEVSFSSTCADKGLATIDTTVNSVDGTATANYTDNGCGGPDTITASITNAPAETGTLNVLPLVISDIVPTSATLAANGNTEIAVTLSEGVGGAPYSGQAIVEFDSYCVQQQLATIAPVQVNAASGVATATYTDQGCSGTDYITAVVTNLENTSIASGTIEITPLVFNGPMVFGVVPPAKLSAFGTTTVKVLVWDGTDGPTENPTTVNFSSICTNEGTATITATATTRSDGTATVTYKDQGCSQTGEDTVTATLPNGVFLNGILEINPPTAGSLVYVSTTPNTTIPIKGTGGLDTAQVKFQVLDNNGQPLTTSQTVNFSLSTTIGGLYLSNLTADSDVDGYVTTTVHSGTIGTAVVVTAWTDPDQDPLTLNDIYSQSEELSVSTGLPDQDSLSISTASWNPPNMWEVNDVQVTINVGAGDHFNNPVKDGTTFYFTTECGVIQPSCTTTGGNGACSVQLTSRSPRVSDGDCSILVYTIGEESFDDGDGDGLADAGEFGPGSKFGPDKGEPWLDANENGLKDGNEFYADFNGNGSYDGPNSDPNYNGVLCNETPDPLNPTRVSTPAGICSSQDRMFVWENVKMEWSSRTVGSVVTAPDPIGLDDCTTPLNVLFNITDINGNSMATGTTINIEASEGILINGGAADTDTVPATPKTDFTFQLKGSETCVTGFEELTVTVTPPGGSAQKTFVPVNVVPLFLGDPIAFGIGAGSLSAYSQTTATVTVWDDPDPLVGNIYTTPIPIEFTSGCASVGRATIEPASLDTQSGTATVLYTDKGCGGLDTITARIPNGDSVSTTLDVLALTMDPISPTPINSFGTGTIQATLKEGVANYPISTPVTFTSICVGNGLATITSPAITVNGVATATYTDNGCPGQDFITASVPSFENGPTQTGLLTINPLHFSDLVFGFSPALALPAYGSTTIKTDVLDSLDQTVTKSLNVNFTSACATNGQATITASASSQGGTATAYYTDKGCGSDDYITASIDNGPSTFKDMPVNSLSIDDIVLGVATLPAYTSTTLSVDVLDGLVKTALPFTVAFDSGCASTGRAIFEKTVNTIAGTATTTYTDNGCGQSDIITATITNGPATAITNGPSTDTTLVVNTLTLDTMTFGTGIDPLDAYGQTTVSVDVLDGGAKISTPFILNFASDCASRGLATITSSVTNNNGTATATYTDKGCGITDVINVTIPALDNSPSQTGFLAVNQLTMGDITFAPSSDVVAYGTTTASAQLYNGPVADAFVTTNPFTVNFSSGCSASGAASFTPSSANTSNGLASSTYEDNGCQGQDTVTASVEGLSYNLSKQATINVTPLTFDTVGFGSGTIAAFGSTTVTAKLLQGVDPYTIGTTLRFTSTCVEAGLASFDYAERITGTDGTATVTYQDAGCNGLDKITITTPDLNNGPQTIDYLAVEPVTLSAFTFGTDPDPLLPYESTTASVTVKDPLGADYTVPMIVNFSSICTGEGKATITPSVLTDAGTATATYIDNGCGKTDTITATVTYGPSNTGSLIVEPLTMTDVTPTDGTLQANESTAITVTLEAGTFGNYPTPTKVAFSSICLQDGKATITPQEVNTSGGIATAVYTDQGCTGDDLIVATLPDIADGPSSTGIIQIKTLTMGSMTFGVEPVSAYGTTTAQVLVQSNAVDITTPVVVNFTSLCAEMSPPKATIDASVVTHNTVAVDDDSFATATYTDDGCLVDDYITASIVNGPTVSGTLPISPADVGSLQYVSTSPSPTISLRGTSVAGSSDIALVKFRVLDAGGNPPSSSRTVDFSLSTTVGGISLTAASAITDIDGYVEAEVNAGTVGTSLRLTASTVTDGGTTLYSQSEELLISTGYPDQDSLTVYTATAMPAGFWESAAVTSALLTVRASDHFNNPVPDGTTVYFTTECGSIESNCATLDGGCSVTLTNTLPKAGDGVCSILFYAIGEESFTDLDGDGLADGGEYGPDEGEPWLDVNESGGAREADEPFVNYGGTPGYDGPNYDTKFNGVLCNENTGDPDRVSDAGSCSSQNTMYVWDTTTMYWSSQSVGIVAPAAVTALPSCAATNSETLTITDENGNSLATGSVISLTTDPEFSVSPNSFVIGTSPQTAFDVDITGSGSCITGDSGTLTVTTTPSGGTADIQTITIPAVANTNPVAVDDPVTAPAGSSNNTYLVLGNDSDPEGHPITIESIDTTGTLGTVSFTATDVVFTPDPAAVPTDTDSFTYTITDGYLTDTATVNVTIN